MDNSTSELKQCKRCFESFPATNQYFHRKNKAPDGLFEWCKCCKNKYERERKTREHVQERESKRKQSDAYRLGRLDYDRNLRASPAYHEQEQTEKRRKLNAACVARYRKSNPEGLRARRQNRRARVRHAHGTHTADDIQLLLKSQKHKCWWCGKRIKANGYHVDHRIPLSRGGSNAPENLCITCPTCNLSKHDKLPQEWNGRLL